MTGHFKHRILSTGNKFPSDFVAICSVRNGKISAYNFIEDLYALWKALPPTDWHTDPTSSATETPVVRSAD